MKLINAIKTRRSIRAFDDRPVEDEKIGLLFEAARWAPSSRNQQPWFYYFAKSDNKRAFERFIDCLNPGNQVWTRNAPLIILSVAKKNFDYKSRPNKHFFHDAGASNMNLVLQAADMGLQAHQMAGYNRENTIGAFGINEESHEPVTFIAIGYPGNPESLPEDLREKENKPRVRKNINEFVIQVES